jgi:23S rRNA (uracil1939-C5)-methyltransferase
VARRLAVTGLDAEGRGTATLNGRSLIVGGVLPGEDVEALVPASGEGACTLVGVLESSPCRVAPRCRHAAECGGCTWQHVAYPEQLRLERAALQRTLDAALGRRSVAVEPVLPTPAASGTDGEAPWGFRHKVHFALDRDGTGRVVMGHMRAGTRHVFDAQECPVHAARGNEVAFAVKRAVQRAGVACGAPPSGVVRHVVSRVAKASGEVVTTLVASTNAPPLKRVSRHLMESPEAPDGWHLNLHPRPSPLLFGPETRRLAGRDRVRDQVAGVSFLVSPTSFFQTNVAAAELLACVVLDAVPGDGRRVLDLYAGLGFFALPLAMRGHDVTAVEDNESSVSDGELSARFNRVPAARCRFLRAPAEQATDRLARRGERVDSVVLDPPRAGAGRGVTDAIAAGLRPERIVYVSCFPDALGRDLARLTSGTAYRLTRVVPIDMFPHTAHVETVAVLERSG